MSSWGMCRLSWLLEGDFRLIEKSCRWQRRYLTWVNRSCVVRVEIVFFLPSGVACFLFLRLLPWFDTAHPPGDFPDRWWGGHVRVSHLDVTKYLCAQSWMYSPAGYRFLGRCLSWWQPNSEISATIKVRFSLSPHLPCARGLSGIFPGTQPALTCVPFPSPAARAVSADAERADRSRAGTEILGADVTHVTPAHSPLSRASHDPLGAERCGSTPESLVERWKSITLGLWRLCSASFQGYLLVGCHPCPNHSHVISFSVWMLYSTFVLSPEL